VALVGVELAAARRPISSRIRL